MALFIAWRNGYGGWAFRGRGATSDPRGGECLEKGSHVGQTNFEKAERESPESVCYTGRPAWSGEGSIDITTTTTKQAASL